MIKRNNLNIYEPTLRNGKSNPYHLKRVLGNGPSILKYQRCLGKRPGYYYSPETPNYVAYSFSQIKKIVEPVFDPNASKKLQAWRERVGEKEADRICYESKTAGEMGHKTLENWAQNKPFGPCPMDMRDYKQALINDILPHLHQEELRLSVTDSNGEVLVLSEIFVADFETKFIGRLDLVARISTEPFHNQRVLLELKGSIKPKRLEFMHPHIIQGVAYQSSFNKIAAAYPNHVEPLDGVALAYMYSQGYGQFVPILGPNLEQYEQHWKQWLNCFHSQLQQIPD